MTVTIFTGGIDLWHFSDGRTSRTRPWASPRWAGASPGVQKDESVDPEMEAMLLTAPAGQRRIGRAEIAEAISILTRYKQGKASLEERVVQDELWWELRHWEAIRKGKQRTDNPEYRGAGAVLCLAVQRYSQ